MQQPNHRFLASAAYHAPPVAARVVEVAAPPVLAPAPPLTLTVQHNARDESRGPVVVLGAALHKAIPGLKAGRPIDLVPPARRGGVWHLDCRPTASRRLSGSEERRPSFRMAHRLTKEHLLSFTGGGNGPGRPFQQQARARLLLALVPGPPAVKDYYPLVPVLPAAALDFATARALYEQGLTLQQVGEALGVSKWPIGALFRRHGYACRRP